MCACPCVSGWALSFLFPNVGERPPGQTGSSPQESPRLPGRPVSTPAPAAGLRGRPRSRQGEVARPPPGSSWAPPGPAPGGGGRGAERAGKGGDLAPSGLPARHWRKVAARHGEGSSLKSSAHNGQRALRGGFSRAPAGSNARGEPGAPRKLTAGRAPSTATPPAAE